MCVCVCVCFCVIFIEDLLHNLLVCVCVFSHRPRESLRVAKTSITRHTSPYRSPSALSYTQMWLPHMFPTEGSDWTRPLFLRCMVLSSVGDPSGERMWSVSSMISSVKLTPMSQEVKNAWSGSQSQPAKEQTLQIPQVPGVTKRSAF